MSYERIKAIGSNPAKIRFSYDTDFLFNSVSLRSTYRGKNVKNTGGESQLNDVALSQDEKDIIKEFLSQAIYDVFGDLFKITEVVDDSIFFDVNTVEDVLTGTVTVSAGAAAVVGVNTLFLTELYVGSSIKIASEYFTVGAIADDTNLTLSANHVAGAAAVAAYTGIASANKRSGGDIEDKEAFNVNLLPNIDKKIENSLRYFILAEWYGAVGMGEDLTLNYNTYLRYKLDMNNLTFQLRKPLMS